MVHRQIKTEAGLNACPGAGWGTGIRTPIDGSKVRSPAVRRSPIGEPPMASRRQLARRLSPVGYPLTRPNGPSGAETQT
jgi:hypothetical protein